MKTKLLLLGVQLQPVPLAHTEQMSSAYFFLTMSWPVAHEELKNHFAGRIHELRENPQLGRDFLETLKDAHAREFFEHIIRKNTPEIDEATLHEVVEQLVHDLKTGKMNNPEYFKDTGKDIKKYFDGVHDEL